MRKGRIALALALALSAAGCGGQGTPVQGTRLAVETISWRARLPYFAGAASLYGIPQWQGVRPGPCQVTEAAALRSARGAYPRVYRAPARAVVQQAAFADDVVRRGACSWVVLFTGLDLTGAVPPCGHGCTPRLISAWQRVNDRTVEWYAVIIDGRTGRVAEGGGILGARTAP